MSYSGISVKEAINNINCSVNGWFLPAVQRPFVWGSRYESEIYICKLFDSILKSYPIGGLIIWNTGEKIPYREFVSNYIENDIPQIVDQGLHGRKDKWLVYDGQQRLQTLYSCLKHSFNGKVLIYDLLFNAKQNVDPEKTGFSFVEANTALPWHKIRMNELFSKQPDEEKRKYRKQIINNNPNILESEEEAIEINIDLLWDIFVKTETKSLAYFPIQTTDESEVNEIFERLNSGGMALSLSDLLFSKIKAKNYDFEEDLQNCSKRIYNITGKGYQFNAYHILQVIYLIVKKQVRIDPKKVNESDIDDFIRVWSELEAPIIDFFHYFLWEQFKINNNSIVPRNLALLPIIIYLYFIHKKGFSYKNITSSNLKTIKQFFIKSQINDWNMQSYIDNFHKIISEAADSTNNIFDFPLPEIENFISKKKQRQIEIHEDSFVSFPWFSLKILTPNRIYQFDPDIRGRFNPEIDHIFPIKLKGQDSNYSKDVDIVWNMQPTRGDINGMKSNIHPKLFFTDAVQTKNGTTIIGSSYINEYDFLLPQNNNTVDFNAAIWNDPRKYIEERKKIMKVFLMDAYNIDLEN